MDWWIIFWIWIGINIAGFAFSAPMYLMVNASESESRLVRAISRVLLSSIFLPAAVVAFALGIIAMVLRSAAWLFSKMRGK